MYCGTPSPPRAVIASGIPFVTYPVPFQPCFTKLFAHLDSFMLRGWANLLRMTDEEKNDGLFFIHRLISEDPSYFYMNLLSIAGDLDGKGQIGYALVPWLTSKVVESINEAISDPERSLSAPTIMTVGRIMFREILVGDPKVGQDVHRKAFAKMVVLAGGVDAMGLPEVVRCSWAWTERLLARKTGVLITQMEPSLISEKTFRSGGEISEDVRVLQAYHEKGKWNV